jgi:hypothetical protein
MNLRGEIVREPSQMGLQIIKSSGFNPGDEVFIKVGSIAHHGEIMTVNVAKNNNGLPACHIGTPMLVELIDSINNAN